MWSSGWGWFGRMTWGREEGNKEGKQLWRGTANHLWHHQLELVYGSDARTGQKREMCDGHPEVNPETVVRPRICCGVVNSRRGRSFINNKRDSRGDDGRLVGSIAEPARGRYGNRRVSTRNRILHG